MKCNNCGNEYAYYLKTGYTVKNEKWEYCDRCGGSRGIPDVYWDGTEEHGLPDNPETGKPYVFTSKFEKAMFLKQNHLREAGDKVHGSKIHYSRENVENKTERDYKARESVNKALAFVGQMGKDYRRQEYLRIQKESLRSR